MQDLLLTRGRRLQNQHRPPPSLFDGPPLSGVEARNHAFASSGVTIAACSDKRSFCISLLLLLCPDFRKGTPFAFSSFLSRVLALFFLAFTPQEAGKSFAVVSMGGNNIRFDCGMHMGHLHNLIYPDFSRIPILQMKAGCMALVVCLNVGVDPPDVIKISPCARMECWIEQEKDNNGGEHKHQKKSSI